MATTVSLTDGTTTINLNAATSTTIGTEWVRLPRLNRQYARVGAFPFVDGQRTIAAGLNDSEIEIACHIRGATTDAIDSQLISLHRLLEAARQWEETGVEAPVRLSWKRDGTTNTAYWTVRYGSVELNRDPEWLPAETAGKILHLLVRLVVEPVAHAGALTTLTLGTTLTNQPVSNNIVMGAAAGDSGYYPVIEITRTDAGAAWTNGYLAIAADIGEHSNLSGTADADAYGGAAQEIVNPGTGAASTLSSLITSARKNQYPMRVIARIKVVSGTPSKVQVQSVLVYGINGPTIRGPWVTFPGTATGSYMIMDLGTVSLLDALKRQATSTLQFVFGCYVRTSDGSSATIRVDIVELLPYIGFVKLTDLNVIQDRKLIYEQVQAHGTFFFPRLTPLAYILATTGELFQDVTRQGSIPRPRNNDALMVTWFYGQTDTAHTLTHTATVTTKALPLYALGLRGAA